MGVVYIKYCTFFCWYQNNFGPLEKDLTNSWLPCTAHLSLLRTESFIVTPFFFPNHKCHPAATLSLHRVDNGCNTVSVDQHSCVQGLWGLQLPSGPVHVQVSALPLVIQPPGSQGSRPHHALRSCISHQTKAQQAKFFSFMCHAHHVMAAIFLAAKGGRSNTRSWRCSLVLVFSTQRILAQIDAYM